MCLTQEYIFQTAFLSKAAIVGVICSVTWMVITKLKLPSRQQFSYRAAVWMLLPLICMPISIINQTGELFCIHREYNREVIVYTLVFLLPLFACVSLDLILYFKMRQVLVNLVDEQQQAKHHNPYNAKLLPLIQKLKYFPLAFAMSWSMELLLMSAFLFGYENDMFGVFAGCGMNSTGISVAAIYFYHQKEHPPVIKRLSQSCTMLMRCCMCQCHLFRSNSALDESLIESSVISKTQSELPMTTVSSSLGPSTHTFSVSRSSITGENGGYGHYSHGGGFSPDGADDEADLVEDE
jgi:hypothetical protein